MLSPPDLNVQASWLVYRPALLSSPTRAWSRACRRHAVQGAHYQTPACHPATCLTNHRGDVCPALRVMSQDSFAHILSRPRLLTASLSLKQNWASIIQLFSLRSPLCSNLLPHVLLHAPPDQGLRASGLGCDRDGAAVLAIAHQCLASQPEALGLLRSARRRARDKMGT